ncbi:protein-disulfide reductase DsbD domain-containing protein [Mucilaginibacter sp. AW1-3]
MKKLLIAFATILFSASTYAQIESHVKWAEGVKKVSATEAVILVKATIDEGWHIYSVNQKDGGPVKTTISLTPSKDFSLVGKTIEPTPVTKFEKSFGINVSYFENSVVFQQKIKLKTKQTVVKGKIEFMTCDDHKCLPPEDIDFSVAIK